MKQKEGNFHEILRAKINRYVHLVYDFTKTFPKSEMYGVVSQLRRAALSVMLNYIEGYARKGDKVHKNFLQTSYGSLKESTYLLEFSRDESFLEQNNYQETQILGDEIGAMLWSTIEGLEHTASRPNS